MPRRSNTTGHSETERPSSTVAPRKVVAFLALVAAAGTAIAGVSSVMRRPEEQHDHLMAKRGDAGGHGHFDMTPPAHIYDPEKFIHDASIRPGFVSLFNESTTNLFNLTTMFGSGATSLESALSMNQRDMSRAQKMARLMIQQWQRDVVENGRGTAYAGVEDVRQISDIKRIAVDDKEAITRAVATGISPAEAMRQCFRDKVLIPLVVNHCLRGVMEMGLYPDLPKFDYVDGSDPKAFDRQIDLLKSNEDFMRDIDEISRSLNPKTMKEFAKQVAEFDWKKALDDTTPSPSKMRSATAADLFGAEVKGRDEGVRADNERRNQGKRPPMGGAGGGLRGGGR